jgi:hypothetical protein
MSMDMRGATMPGTSIATIAMRMIIMVTIPTDMAITITR